MENKKQMSSPSSSSLSSSSSSSSSLDHLFGPKDSSPSSKSGIFGTIFPPPSKVPGPSAGITGSWNYSSSIHYGGQENYSLNNNTHSPNYGQLKKNEEDDPNGSKSSGASRGNWWQGSLYY